MQNQTYYQASAAAPTPLPLNRSCKVQVAIVGAGFAGLNTAYGLLKRGVREVLVLEAETLGHGASGRNGGFVFAGYSLGEGALLRRFGQTLAQRMYARTVAAVNELRARIKSLQLECELSDHGVLWANWFRDPEVLRRRQALLKQHYGVDWQWLDAEEIGAHVRSARYRAGLYEPNAFHMHPLKYLLGLAGALRTAGIPVYDQSRVSRLEPVAQGWRLSCNGFEVEAEHVVVACGGYLANLVPALQRALMPIATYVMVTEALGKQAEQLLPSGAAIYDTRFAFDYYRRLLDQRLLWGGRISMMDRAPDQVAMLLRRDLLRVFPQLHAARIEYAWSGLMSYARHEMPQMGQLQPGLWFAQGFGGHGLAPTLVAGELIAGAIAHADPAWQDYRGAGLDAVFGVCGRLAAQATYSWLQWRDQWKDWREQRLA